jgi:diaminopimelate epimerase
VRAAFARFVLDKRLTAKRQIRVETKSGIIELDVRNDGQIGVNMGAPRLVPADIPFQAPEQALSYQLDVDGTPVELAAVSMGNPHAVLRVSDINNAPVHELGPKIEHHPRFPARVNVGFSRSSTATARNCASGSAAPGKPRPAVPAPAPPPWPRSARGGWIRRC